MQKGINSDVNVRGKSYHIQTEDWGVANPYLVSRVFANGAVLKTVKTNYKEAIKTENAPSAELIREALRRQHNAIMEELFSGQI